MGNVPEPGAPDQPPARRRHSRALPGRVHVRVLVTGYAAPPSALDDASRRVGRRRRGRPPGPQYTEATFPAALDAAIRHVQHATGRARVDRRSVWRRLLLHRTAFYACIARYLGGLRWREIRANYADSELRGQNLRENEP